MKIDGLDSMADRNRTAVFDNLNGLNINGHTEQKKVSGKELTYLSWPWAWAEVKKRYPDARYTIWKNEQGLPYTEDPLTGYMVYTSVTIDGVTHEMWLPVMDGANKAMKRQAYEYMTKYNGKKTCEAADMMDINKTIMRCLVKNLAMFGLGLYIYAGEDLPESEKDENEQNAPPKPQNAQENGTVSKTDRLPQAKPEAGRSEPPKHSGAEPADGETPGAYLKRRIAEFKGMDKEFDFMTSRAALIRGGIVEDIPSATMNMQQARHLMDAIEKNCLKAG